MFAEMEDQPSLDRLRAQLVGYVARGKPPDPAAHSALAIAYRLGGMPELALEHGDRALAAALRAEDKEEMCYALLGLAHVHHALGRSTEARRKLEHLAVVVEVLALPDLLVCSQILEGELLVEARDFASALEVYWCAIENAREKKSLFTYVRLLFAIATAHAEAGEPELGKPYVSLAQRMTDPKNFVRLSRSIAELAQRVSMRAHANLDLVLNVNSNSVTERRKGRVDFKNQFILLDLLKVFLRTPGQVHSKEALVKAVWKQDYDPTVHDNKIYVTIKRLRQLIEPDFDKPKYIYRAKNGYYLNRNARTAIQ
jgi:DNA-binding winged helix-turn-helix (wHTH) protein